jgi:carboxypeptidase T
MSKKIICFLVFAAIASNAFASMFHGDDHSNIPEEFKTPKTIFANIQVNNLKLEVMDLKSLDVDILGVNLKEKNIDVLISADQLIALEKKKFKINLATEKNLLRRPDQEYKNSDEIAAFLSSMSEQYSSISKLIKLGESVEGRDIWGIKISDNPEEDELEPAILFNSMHHAREVMTPEVGIDIVEYLLKNYTTDSKVKSWVDSNEIYVVPMLNVDGNNRVWTRDSMWRKNTQGGYGVDINRNYPHKWASCNGSSGSRWSQTYRGPEAASEPETRALMNLVSSIKPVFNISYHSYSELVLYPYGCPGEKTEIHALVSGIGKKIGELLDYTPGTPWEILYGVDGGDVDWMYADEQVIPYVIELNSTREGFQPSYSKWRDKTVERNRPAWMHLLDRLEQSGVRGLVYDESEELTDKFVVEVLDSNDNKIQDYRGNPDGSFHIVLSEGDYKLNIKRTDSRSIKSQILSVSSIREDIEVRF